METKSNNPNNRKSEYIRLIIGLIILIAIIGTFLLYLSWPLLVGKTIVLATQPVDPFDVLRGQYITIAYEIGTIPSLENVREGDAVYVYLVEDEQGIFRYESASFKPFSEGVSIRGKVISANEATMRLEYGIEQYFFERNAHVSMRNVTVEAKVSPEGQARITRLLQDGKKLKIVYQNSSFLS